jgi:hypothetical protein
MDVLPVISLDDAINVGLTHQETLSEYGEIPENQELIIFPWEDSYYLCWYYMLTSDSYSARWEYFIDAASGEIIYYANRIIYN